MIIDCVSDLHGHYPKLEGGDLLIVAGDLTARHTKEEALDFIYWLSEQDYKEKIIIAGNHDSFVIHNKNWFVEELESISKSLYLCDSGTEFEGLKIWGSPWTAYFPGMNPHCMAFTMHYGCDTDDWLDEKWQMIPDDTDILITHSPPYGILDKTKYGKHVGSKSLVLKIGNMECPPKLWVWGHIHESYGEDLPVRQKPCKMINASLVNEHYEPVNKPIRVIL